MTSSLQGLINDASHSTWNGSETTESNMSNFRFEPMYSWTHVYITTIILGVLILLTVVGNVFVVAAIILEKNLQSVSNYLILSLAVADLMVATLVMPISALREVSKRWWLGMEMCDVWVCFDVLCCTASILHLIAIALDRYWAVTNVDYIQRRTAQRIIYMIIGVWVSSVMISIPARFHVHRNRTEWKAVMVHGECHINEDYGYTIFSTVGAFYLPMAFMICIYIRIYHTARNRIRKKTFKKKSRGSSLHRRSRKGEVTEEDLEDQQGVTSFSQYGQRHRHWRKIWRSKQSQSTKCESSRDQTKRFSSRSHANNSKRSAKGSSANNHNSQHCSAGSCKKNSFQPSFNKHDKPEPSLCNAVYIGEYTDCYNAHINTVSTPGPTIQMMSMNNTTVTSCDVTHENCENYDLLDSYYVISDDVNSFCCLDEIDDIRYVDDTDEECSGDCECSDDLSAIPTACNSSPNCMMDTVCHSFDNNGATMANPVRPAPSPASSMHCQSYTQLSPLSIVSSDSPPGQLKQSNDTVPSTSSLILFSQRVSCITRSTLQVPMPSITKQNKPRTIIPLKSSSTSALTGVVAVTTALVNTDAGGSKEAERNNSTRRQCSCRSRQGSQRSCHRHHHHRLHREGTCSTINSGSSRIRDRAKVEQRRERKAARTLAIITGCFLLCWLPFCISALVVPFCGKKCHMPIPVTSFMVWLGYLNSLLNPVIYTTFSPDFRNAFRKILVGRYHRSKQKLFRR